MAHSLSTCKRLAIGLAPSLWGSADLLLRRPQSLCTAAPGPQLLHHHGDTGLQLPQGMGMVGTAQVAEASHELLGHLVIAPAVKESTGTEGAAFQSLFQPAGGGNVLLLSLSPLKARWGHGTPCPQPSPVPRVIRAKARGLAQSAPYLPDLLPTHLRSSCSKHSSLLQAPPAPQGLCTSCSLCPKGFPLTSFRSLLKQHLLSGSPSMSCPLLVLMLVTTQENRGSWAGVSGRVVLVSAVCQEPSNLLHMLVDLTGW